MWLNWNWRLWVRQALSDINFVICSSVFEYIVLEHKYVFFFFQKKESLLCPPSQTTLWLKLRKNCVPNWTYNTRVRHKATAKWTFSSWLSAYAQNSTLTTIIVSEVLRARGSGWGISLYCVCCKTTLPEYSPSPAQPPVTWLSLVSRRGNW